LDGDLVVGASDLALWEAGFGTAPPASFTDGDVNGDLRVNGTDFLLWQQEFGPVGVQTVALVSLPEPASFLLVGFGLGCLLLRWPVDFRGPKSTH
jgi:hypothetical protein